MITGRDKDRFNELREKYEELQNTFQRMQENYIQVRVEFLINQSNRLRIHNSMIKLHATIINERYSKYTDLSYCSIQILQHSYKIDEVARELKTIE